MIYFQRYFSDRDLSIRKWQSCGRRVYPIVAAIYVPEELLQGDEPITVHLDDAMLPLSFLLRRTVRVPVRDDFSPNHHEIQKAINSIETYVRVNVFLPGYMPSSTGRASTVIQVPRSKQEYCYAEVIFVDEEWKSQSFTVGDCGIIQNEAGALILSIDPLVNSETRLLSRIESRDSQNVLKDEDPLELYAGADIDFELDVRLPDADTDEKHLILN
jgi:hypothetical protein